MSEKSVLQLIYTSHQAQPLTREDLSFMLKKARCNNRAYGITGLLVYDDGFFMQVLEGDPDNVQTLYSFIEKDKRHKNLNLLLEKELKAREFESWSMGYVDTKIHLGELEGFTQYYSLQDTVNDSASAKQKLRMFQNGAWRFAEHA